MNLLWVISIIIGTFAAMLTIFHYLGWLDQEDKTKNLDRESQSVKAGALLSAAAELEQIANNFEVWAEGEHDRFRRGVSPSDIDKWMADWLSDSYIAGLFNYPVARQKNGPFPNGSKKEFRLIIDTFQLYMPSIAASLTDTYNSFLQSIKFHIQHYEIEKQKEDPILLFWCDNFIDMTVVPTAKRLRHIAKMVKEELATEAAIETEQNDTRAKGWGIKRIISWIFAKTSHFILTVIGAIVVAVIAAIVVDIFADFGWLQSIKEFIRSISLPK
jgi:uncharacterized protein YggT (Ycf19 family)